MGMVENAVVAVHKKQNLCSTSADDTDDNNSRHLDRSLQRIKTRKKVSIYQRKARFSNTLPRQSSFGVVHWDCIKRIQQDNFE